MLLSKNIKNFTTDTLVKNNKTSKIITTMFGQPQNNSGFQPVPFNMGAHQAGNKPDAKELMSKIKGADISKDTILYEHRSKIYRFVNNSW